MHDGLYATGRVVERRRLDRVLTEAVVGRKRTDLGRNRGVLLTARVHRYFELVFANYRNGLFKHGSSARRGSFGRFRTEVNVHEYGQDRDESNERRDQDGDYNQRGSLVGCVAEILADEVKIFVHVVVDRLVFGRTRTVNEL